jgi:hypothetical protein
MVAVQPAVHVVMCSRHSSMPPADQPPHNHLQQRHELRGAEGLLRAQRSEHLPEGAQLQRQHVEVRGQVHATLLAGCVRAAGTRTCTLSA